MSFYNSSALPWTVAEEDEERFRRILKRLLIFFLLLCLIWPWLPVPKVDRKLAEEISPRIAKLVLENRKQPPPPPVEIKAAETAIPENAKAQPEVAKPEKKEIKKEIPVETAKRTEVARQKASRSGLLALRDELADLRDTNVASKLNKDLKPGPGLGTGVGPGVGNAKGPAMGEGARAIITGNATSGSGGIVVSRLSQGTGGGGLAGRSTTQVNSPIGGGGGGGGGPGGSLQRGAGGKASRSLEEIRLVFDRNKGSIYTIYNRALREDPGLQGKVVLRLTIAPSGQVIDCQLVSSELRAPELERKLLARIKQFDFGSKDAEVMVVTYPIDFLPS